MIKLSVSSFGAVKFHCLPLHLYVNALHELCPKSIPKLLCFSMIYAGIRNSKRDCLV